MSDSHQEMDLSITQVQILRNIKLMGKISREKVHEQKRGKYRFLFYYDLLDKHPTEIGAYCLSPKAESYLRYRRKDRLRFYLPILISVFALIISVVALLKQ